MSDGQKNKEIVYKLSKEGQTLNTPLDILKEPYVFEFLDIKENKPILEKNLETKLIKHMEEFLLELGKGFSFVGNQYKISMEDRDYYIDLLFYHLELRCYIVVELKATSFKPEYIGQLGFYVTAIDETLKKEIDNPTLGLLLCKEKKQIKCRMVT